MEHIIISITVWIPKYRKKILKGTQGIPGEGLVTIQQFHPDVVIEKFSLQVDQVHLIRVIPLSMQYRPSSASSKPTRAAKSDPVPWLKKIYWRTEFWSVGSSPQRWASMRT